MSQRTLVRCVLAGMWGMAGGVAPAEANVEAVHSSHASGRPDLQSIPSPLSLSEALQRAQAYNPDRLLANIARLQAEAKKWQAAALPNPTASFGAGPTFNYNATPPACTIGCSRVSLAWRLSDEGATFEQIAGLRALRVRVAEAHKISATHGQQEAQRELVLLVKGLYLDLLLALAQEEEATQQEAWLAKTQALAQARYPGLIDEGILARMDMEALSARQQREKRVQEVRRARIALAMALGVREAVEEFAVIETLDTFQAPTRIGELSERELLAMAWQKRPDLHRLRGERAQAAATLALEQRKRLPTVELQLLFSGIGNGQDAASPPFVAPGVATTLPVFSQAQGEMHRAKADVQRQAVRGKSGEAQVVAEVQDAWYTWQSLQRTSAQCEGPLLTQAGKAVEIVRVQHKEGAVDLTVLLDAERTYRRTRLSCMQIRANSWKALFRLEAATGGGEG